MTAADGRGPERASATGGLGPERWFVGLAVTLVGFGPYSATDADEASEPTEKGATPWTG